MAGIRQRRARLVAVGLALLACPLTTGCSSIIENSARNPVGFWVSHDGESSMILNEDHSGTFTLCHPDPSENGLRYDYSAMSWPSTIAISWEPSSKTDPGFDYSGNRIYLNQDPTTRSATRIGFNGGGKILVWANGNLEMGADLVVTYKKRSAASFSCNP